MSKQVEEIIHNVTNVDVASNELFISHVLNRNFAKLFNNDDNLLNNSHSIYSGTYRVLPWSKDKTYQKNDIVFFVMVDSEKNDATLYLLRAIINEPGIPRREYVEEIPHFEASGWENVNPMGGIYTDTFDKFTTLNLKTFLNEAHNKVEEYHKFGELSSYSELSKHVLKTDLTNIDADREHVFFPNETIALDGTNTIIEGTMRKWDCGLVEYDIMFKLGDLRSTYDSYNADGSLKVTEQVDANSLNLTNRNFGGGQNTIYDNRRYYLNESDADIFNLENGTTKEIGGIVQTNVNKFVNAYTGTIKFPMPFIDTYYSIMTTNIPSASGSSADESNSNINTIVYVNKSKQQVTALLVIPNYESNTYRLLSSNKFRCRITGRWK